MHVMTFPGLARAEDQSLMHCDGEGTATLEIDSGGVVRAKDLVRMGMPIWYDAMQAAPEAAARVRGVRAEAWLAPARETVSTGAG